jgi:ribonuclease-3
MPVSDSDLKESKDQKDQKIFNQAPKESGSRPEAEAKVFNPWNPRNKIIDDATLHAILSKYGVTEPLPHPELFRQACVHKSYVDRREEWASEAAASQVAQKASETATHRKSSEDEEPLLAERPPNCLPLQEADNEESEFAGDSLLGCVVALYLYERYAGKGEGFLTRLRTRIVNNKMLGELAKKLGLEPWIIVSRHVEDVCVGGRGNLRLLGSMLEAWIYALFKNFEDSQSPGGGSKGFKVVRTFLVNVIQRHVNFVELITDDTNFKDQLLRHFQATYHQPPRYREVSVVGPPHDRVFTMGVIDPANESKVIAKATARNKKVAEQEASRLALAALCPES